MKKLSGGKTEFQEYAGLAPSAQHMVIQSQFDASDVCNERRNEFLTHGLKNMPRKTAGSKISIFRNISYINYICKGFVLCFDIY